MITLGIETCSPSGGVALFDGQRILGSQTIFSQKAHSRLILPALQFMLRELSLSLGDIGAVAVSRGPGAFTGVRVGLTIAKALTEAGTPHLVTVSTLEALASHCWSGELVQTVLPLLSARRGELYGAAWSIRKGGRLEPQTEEFVLPPTRLAEMFQAPCLVAGEGAREWRADLERILPEGSLWARPSRFDPSPEAVAVLGWEKATAGHFEDPETAAPTYLREPAVSTPSSKPKYL